MSEEQERGKIRDILEILAKQRILSASNHANMSILLDDGERLILANSTLTGPVGGDIAIVDLEGNVLEEGLSPAGREIISMHTQVYRDRTGTQCVIHTHSPFATGFAATARPMPLVTESLARLGDTGPVPVAGWAPRGSEASIRNIVDVLDAEPSASALLLGNHGVLGWGADADAALRRIIALEENAQAAYYAQAFGGPNVLSMDDAREAKERRATFEQRGGQPTL